MPTLTVLFSGRCLFTLVAVLLAMDFFASCDRKPSAPGPDKSNAVVLRNAEGEDWTVSVEIARTPAERAEGLMYRWSLEDDHGMLFIFDDVEVRSFWMKNTRIPLDMIFIGPDKKIVGIVREAEPYTTQSRTVGVPSQYVLEVYGGEAEEHGLSAGDRVFFFLESD